MSRVLVIGGARTPLGVYHGNLRDYKEHKLGALTMNLAIEQAKVEPETLTEVIVGTAKQTSCPSNVARHSLLEAKLPDSIPAYTVQRQSASGIQAVANGLWAIKSGMAESILAGGCESMSHAPREIHNGRYSFNEKTRMIFEPFSAQVAGAQPIRQFGALGMEVINLSIAKEYQISDSEMKEYAKRSIEKAGARMPRSYMCKLQVKKGKVFEDVLADELYPSPSIISNPADASAMVVLASENYVKKQNTEAFAEILSLGIGAGNPGGSGYVNTEAVSIALKKAGVTLSEVAQIDICEITASQVAATIKQLKKLGLSHAENKINRLGGGLATGSPWGAAGTVQLVDTLYTLERRSIGMVITPAEGGQMMCMILKIL